MEAQPTQLNVQASQNAVISISYSIMYKPVRLLRVGRLVVVVVGAHGGGVVGLFVGLLDKFNTH